MSILPSYEEASSVLVASAADEAKKLAGTPPITAHVAFARMAGMLQAGLLQKGWSQDQAGRLADAFEQAAVADHAAIRSRSDYIRPFPIEEALDAMRSAAVLETGRSAHLSLTSTDLLVAVSFQAGQYASNLVHRGWSDADARMLADRYVAEILTELAQTQGASPPISPPPRQP